MVHTCVPFYCFCFKIISVTFVIMKVLLIYTGGTIGMRADNSDGALRPFDFRDIHTEFPTIKQLGVEVDVLPFEPIDSSNVSPNLWWQLAEAIKGNYDLYDGFVVLHGTDTMAYSASALSFMLSGLTKAVVFTGSQIPIGILRTDGRENLITAIEIAASGRIAEVCLYFQNKLFRGNRTRKISSEEFAAFSSYNYPSLADVGVEIHYNEVQGSRLNVEGALDIDTRIDTNVVVVKLFPGLQESTLRAMLGIEGLKGVVLESYGSGNAPTAEWFVKAIREAIESGIHVMNVTQCLQGGVNMCLYETGQRLAEVGVISGGDITSEAALAKMMCLLGRELPHKDTKRLLETPLCGEMS